MTSCLFRVTGTQDTQESRGFILVYSTLPFRLWSGGHDITRGPRGDVPRTGSTRGVWTKGGGTVGTDEKEWSGTSGGQGNLTDVLYGEVRLFTWRWEGK